MTARSLSFLTAAALGTVVTLVGSVGTELLVRDAEESYVALQTEANRRQALGLKSLLEQQLKLGVSPDDLSRSLQRGLGSSAADPSGFLCLLGDDGRVLCYPDSNVVGMKVGGMSVLDLDRRPRETIGDRLRERRGGPGILRAAGNKQQLVYQLPVPGQPWLVSVHADLDLLHARAVRAGRRVLTVLVPAGFLLVILGTAAVRYVARGHERRIEAMNAELEIRVRRRTEDLSRTNAELQAARATLVQSEKMVLVGQLVSGLAHELNNPLTTIVGQAALDLRTATDGERRHRMERIQAAGTRCANLVRSLLSFARSSPPVRSAQDPAALIRNAVTLIQTDLRSSNVELSLQLPDTLPAVMADPVQIEQVVLNLLNNARQAIESKGAAGRITITAWADQDRIRVTIADTGAGLAPVIREHLFEPFHTTKPEGVGTGLGLSLCQRFVRAHGGSILLSTTGPEGTQFEFHLPVLEAGQRAA